MPKAKSNKTTAAAQPKRQLRRFLTDEAVSNLSEMSRRKRSQIIDAAFACFLELGYQGTSMNAVAERACVIKQTIYSHFANKEALFRSVIQASTLDYVRNELQSPSMKNKSSRDVLIKIAESILSRYNDPRHLKFIRTMFGEVGRFPELAQFFTDATINPGIEIVVTQLTEAGDYSFSDPEAFARIFMFSVIGYCMQQYVLLGRQFSPFEQRRFLDELMRLVDLHKAR